MSNVRKFESKGDIHEQACLWISCIDRGIKSEEKAELQSWVNQSDVHRETLFDMAALWDDLSVMHELSGLFPLNDKKAVEINRSSTKNEWLKHFSMAAGFICLTVILGFTLLNTQSDITIASNSGYYQQMSTAVGEQKTYSLPDGSIVHLNTDSELQVNYSEETRSITLLQGEGHFEVAHNRNRPFIVTAGPNTVTAVGTAFNVQLVDSDNLELLVTEGKVKVEESTPSLSASFDNALNNVVYMESGEKATFSGAQTKEKTTLSLDQVQRALSWQQGMLVFQGEPLAAALEEVSRYTSVQFSMDEEIKNQRVAGFFKVGDIDGLLFALKSNFNIDHEKTEDQVIKLIPAS